jgi:enoyl-CoA hydratase
MYILSSSIEIEKSGPVWTLWLNRPRINNAYNAELLDALELGVRDAERDASNRIIVVRGRGESFCAGADIGWLAAEASWSSLADRVSGVFNGIAESSRITVAAVHGWTVAGGFELMLACDLAVAADDARIGDFHIRNGLFGGAGVIYRLPRLVGPRKARELMLSGEILSGVQAKDWNLVNAVAPLDQLDRLVSDFTARFVDRKPEIVRLTKQALIDAADADFESAARIQRATSDAVARTAGAQAGVAAFLEGRDG